MITKCDFSFCSWLYIYISALLNYKCVLYIMRYKYLKEEGSYDLAGNSISFLHNYY